MALKQALTCLLSTFCALTFAQTNTNKIVVDQFGYRPDAKKIAVIRNPQQGFDANESYSPGTSFSVINTNTNNVELTGNAVVWNNGATDPSSGDKAWWFDFSALTTPGEYYILDATNNTKSFNFIIANDVYNEVLKQAMRVWFYQRSGFAKTTPFADAAWQDGASHIGPLQDKNCRDYQTPNDPASEKDVHGGWYDAGDLNKYTPWTSNYVVELLRAYTEKPTVWTDDYNIPESGNGVPDILDEAKWGIDHLLRMQNNDGSVIAVVSADGASPPSAATAPSLYGGENTVSALTAAGAFAFASIVFESEGNQDYADTLLNRAIKAWDWADANPLVLWYNNDETYGTKGIAAGQQETNDYKRTIYKLRAAAYLFEKTGEQKYSTYFVNNYNNVNMMNWNFVYPFGDEDQDVLLHYAHLPNANQTVATDIKNTYTLAMEKEHNFEAIDNATDPYNAHMDAYTWGSNKQKASAGLTFWHVDYYNLNASRSALALEAAEGYIHYMHGVNPLNITYLTNMGAYGAENSANQIYHTWFHHDTEWDVAGVSNYGPAPGIVPGGPNPSYAVDGCCPSGCGSTANNAKCAAIDLTQVTNQPKQKSYLNFNEGWPLNSWSVTENSMGYQAEYIRLLSKFVAASSITSTTNIGLNNQFKAYPNPATNILFLQNNAGLVEVFSANGQRVYVGTPANSINLSHLQSGIYFVKNQTKTIQFIKK